MHFSILQHTNRVKNIILILILTLPITALGQTVRDMKLAAPKNGVYAGVFPDMGNTEDSLSTDRVREYIQLTGNNPVWICFSNSWFYGIKFPKEKALAVSGFKSIPYIRILPRSSWAAKGPDAKYPLESISDGDFDDELRQWARDAKKFGKPILVEFAPEMNGNWFPWSGVFSWGDEGAGIYKDAHRHVVKLMRDEGAENLTWMYHVNAISEPNEEWNSIVHYYPGDDYIDWIGMSVYGSQKPGWPWAFFFPVFRQAYREMEKISKTKPFAIAEFGVVEDPRSGSKPEWIRDAFETVLGGMFPRIKAISYWHSSFDNADGTISNMRIDSSPEALEMYKSYIGMDIFKAEPVFK